MSTFDAKAREWDTPERRERAEVVAEVIRTNVALTPSTRAIDVGAGTGLLGLALAADVGEMVLAEPSGGMLEVMREKLAATQLASAAGPAKVSAIGFDLLSDAPPAEPFDLAVSLLVLHHLPDPVAALAAVAGLLRSGGRIALVDLDAEDGTFHDDPTGIYHQGFERADIIRLATAAGFGDVETTTATEIEREGRRYPTFLLLGRKR
jgi:SAM-dependent methyltransferase